MKLVVTVCVLLVASLSDVNSKQLPLNVRTAGDEPGKYNLDEERLPENVAVPVNTDVTFRCAVANPDNIHGVQWWEYVYSPLGAIISDNTNVGNHPHRDRYSIVHGDAAEYSLRISPVLMSDGGLYQCLDTWGNPGQKQRHSIRLTVTAAALNCTTTIPENGVVLLDQYHTNECTLTYQGGIIPNMTWSGIAPFTQAYVATTSLIWSGMQYTVTRNMDTRSHVSDTFFTGYFLPVDGDTADNIPTLTFTHRERQLFVYWGPRDITVDPDKEYYEVGDVLTHSADAFPPATFTLTNMRTQEIIVGNQLTITDDWLGEVTTVRCEARNSIVGTIYSANLFYNVSVPFPTTTTTPTTTPMSTLPPAVARCGDVTGAWESTFPGRASLCIKLDLENGGYINGLARNSTDTWWVDVVGRAHSEDFDQLAFAGIQPLDFGVSSFVAECHRCFGVERLLAHVTTRRRGLECGVPGTVWHTDQYEFYRSSTLRCPNLGP